MRSVDQTVFSVPGGNCFSACVASLLGLPLEDVPYFMGWTDEEGSRWFERFSDFLRPLRFYPVFFPVGDGWDAENLPGLYIASGKSPRGDYDHAVVAKGGVIVHDPHPSRDGLDGPTKDVVLLVPFEPRCITPSCGPVDDGAHTEEVNDG